MNEKKGRKYSVFFSDGRKAQAVIFAKNKQQAIEKGRERYICGFLVCTPNEAIKVKEWATCEKVR